MSIEQILAYVVLALWSILGVITGFILKQTYSNQKELYNSIKELGERVTKIETEHKIFAGHCAASRYPKTDNRDNYAVGGRV